MHQVISDLVADILLHSTSAAAGKSVMKRCKYLITSIELLQCKTLGAVLSIVVISCNLHKIHTYRQVVVVV